MFNQGLFATPLFWLNQAILYADWMFQILGAIQGGPSAWRT